MAEKQRSMLSVASTAWEVETAPAPAAPLPREDKAGPKRAPVKLPRQDRTATTEAVGRSAPSRPLVPLSSSTKLADTTPEQAAQVATAIRTKKVEVAKIEIAKTAKVKPDKRVT